MRPHRWLMAIALTTLAGIVLTLPELSPEMPRLVDPIAARLNHADNQLLLREEIARRLHSRTVAAQATTDRADRVIVRGIGPVPPSLIAASDSAAQRWFAALGSIPADRRLIVTLIPDSAVIAAGIPVRVFRTAVTTDLFVPGAIATAGCYLVVRLPATLVPATWSGLGERVATALTPCAPYLRFGEPGEAIAGWLGSTQHTAFTMPVAAARQPPLQRNELARARSGWDLGGRRIRACLAGADKACLAIMDRPAAPIVSWRATVAPRGWIGTGRGFTLWQGSLTATLVMQRLTESLGEETMRKIWTGDQPLAEAIARSTGQSLAAHVRGTLRAMPVDAKAKPALMGQRGGIPPIGSLVGALMLIAATLIIGSIGFDRATGPTRG